MRDPQAPAPPWDEVAAWVEAGLGLRFTPAQQPDLRRGFAAAAARLGCADAEALAERALADRLGAPDRQVLAECLAIGETYFFRDPAAFDEIARRVLRPLVESRRGTTRHLRLWSAGCSSGEEAYSLAMLVARLVPDWRAWSISILATDLNRAALDKARAGAYGRWSLRGPVPPQAHGFLHPGSDGRWHVDAELRRIVRFAPLNLVADDYPSIASATTAMDLVLCRNVLIYFAPERARAVLARLGACLGEGGWLATGAVDVPAGAIPGLERAAAAGLFTRRVQPAPPTSPPAQDPPAAPLRHARPRIAPVVPPARAPQAEAPAGASASALAQQARASADAGDLARAESACRAAIALDKLDPEWSYLHASILSEQGAWEAAAAALRRTLYLAPDHLLARFQLGVLALRAGHAQAGRRHFSQALARLASCPAEDVVQGSGGLTAGELAGIIRRAAEAA